MLYVWVDTIYSAAEYEVSTIIKTSQVNLLADIVLQIAVAILYIITYTYIYIIIYALHKLQLVYSVNYYTHTFTHTKCITHRQVY